MTIVRLRKISLFHVGRGYLPAGGRSQVGRNPAGLAHHLTGVCLPEHSTRRRPTARKQPQTGQWLACVGVNLCFNHQHAGECMEKASCLFLPFIAGLHVRVITLPPLSLLPRVFLSPSATLNPPGRSEHPSLVAWGSPWPCSSFGRLRSWVALGPALGPALATIPSQPSRRCRLWRVRSSIPSASWQYRLRSLHLSSH